MGLPTRFEIVVPPSGQHVGLTSPWTIPGVTPMVDESDVKPYDEQMAAVVEAVNVAVNQCPQISTADRSEWTGIYSSFMTIHGSLAAVMASPFYDVFAKQASYAQILSQEKALAPQIASWQARVAAACPGIISPNADLPKPPEPNPSPSFDWASAIKWTAIAVVAVVAAIYIGPAIAAAAGVAATAIKERAGRRKIEPHSAGFSFGDMAVEAPQIESLHMGDVPQDEVLALLQSAQE